LGDDDALARGRFSRKKWVVNPVRCSGGAIHPEGI
jgi:hypothetical protein